MPQSKQPDYERDVSKYEGKELDKVNNANIFFYEF